MSKKNKKQTNENNFNSNNNEKDKTPIVFQRSKLKSELHIFKRNDLTEKQKELLKLILSKECKLLFIEGPAGTSKTYVTILAMLQLLSDKKISDILYLRSVVESADRTIGLIPGSVDDKVGVYLLPLMDKLEELLPKNEIEFLTKDDRIKGQPINFLRGTHWNVRGIICDESQNLSFNELKTVLTRVGEHSKIIVISDPEQTDIKNSGIKKIMELFNDNESKENGIYKFEFTDEDCVRSKLVKFILKKFKTQTKI